MKQLVRSKMKDLSKKDYALSIKNEIKNRYDTLANPQYGMGPEYRRLRLKRGILQQSVACDGIISLSKYCKFELGQVSLNYNELKYIMKTFDLRESDLFTPYKTHRYMAAMMVYFLQDNAEAADRLNAFLKHRDQNSICLIRFMYATMKNDVEDARRLFNILDGVKRSFEIYELKVYSLFASLYLHRIHLNNQAQDLLNHVQKYLPYHLKNEAMVIHKIRLMMALNCVNLVEVVKHHQALNQDYLKHNYFEAKKQSDQTVANALSYSFCPQTMREWIKEVASHPNKHASALLRTYLRKLDTRERMAVIKKSLTKGVDNHSAFVLLEAAEYSGELIHHPIWLDYCDASVLSHKERLYYSYWQLRVKETPDVLAELLRNKLILDAMYLEDPRLCAYYVSEYGRLLTQEGKYKEAYKSLEHLLELKVKWNSCF